MRYTVALDFDGVIHSYTSGWRGAEVIPDPPVAGVHDAIRDLRKTFRVVVYSTRCETQSGIDAVAAWLLQHDIIVDEVTATKPPAIAYVDDRAVPFCGNWQDVMAGITRLHTAALEPR